jgi:hypothetical protein
MHLQKMNTSHLDSTYRQFLTLTLRNLTVPGFNVRTVHIRRSRNGQKYALIVPLLYSIYWLLHVSAVACHHQGALDPSEL